MAVPVVRKFYNATQLDFLVGNKIEWQRLPLLFRTRRWLVAFPSALI